MPLPATAPPAQVGRYLHKQYARVPRLGHPSGSGGAGRAQPALSFRGLFRGLFRVVNATAAIKS
jgi:hypothetical protein